jgi:hypothetical protein
LRWGFAEYKSLLEVLLDMQRDEYMAELAKSPLERGQPILVEQSLTTAFHAGSAYEPRPVSSELPPPRKLRFRPAPYAGAVTDNRSARSQFVETVTRWNQVDNQFAAFMSTERNRVGEPLTPGDPDLTRLLLDAWEHLAPDDPRNLPLEQVGSLVPLDEAQRARLARAGVTDLRGLAWAIRHADWIEWYRTQVRSLARLRRQPGAENLPEVDRRTLANVPTVAEAAQLRDAIGRALGRRAGA